MNDFINAGFESLAGIFVFLSAWRVYKDKQVRGVSLLMVIFMLSWGIWNLYYYPSLGQWLSFCAGAFLVLGNVCWLALVVRLRLPGAP